MNDNRTTLDPDNGIYRLCSARWRHYYSCGKLNHLINRGNDSEYPDDTALRQELIQDLDEIARLSSSPVDRGLARLFEGMLILQRAGNGQDIDGYEVAVHLRPMYDDRWEENPMKNPIPLYAMDFSGQGSEENTVEEVKPDPEPKAPHTLVVIGFLGSKRCYLDVPVDEAVRRYCESEDNMDEQFVRDNHMINTYSLTDEFLAYDAYAI